MTILNRLYASSGSEVIIETLQIQLASKSYWLTSGWENVVATLEDGTEVTFEGCGIDVSLPAKNADGTQDLKFAISNIDGIVSTAIRSALADLSSATMTYRKFISTDLNAPAERPCTMKIKSGHWDPTVVNFVAGYMNIMDTAWPRHRFTLPEYPGLRYIS